MKTLIVALNSKYIHSALAPWYLKANCGEDNGQITVLEFTINENIDAVLSMIYSQKADVIAFSCYIWNINYVLNLAENLKKVLPEIKIILGGPEVSFDAVEVMREKAFVDYIIIGEGEQSFKLLMGHLNSNSVPLGEIYGLTYRESDEIKINKSVASNNTLDFIASPYTEEMLASLGSRIVYYESSRGCPFSCSYCLSSTSGGVRYFSVDRVKRDLTRLIQANIPQIKFVDRTFNCNKARAKEIFKFIIHLSGQTAGKTNFHFEVAADLFDEEILEILSGAPWGLIQFEIGVQTMNLKTLENIHRKTEIEKIILNVNKIRQLGNIHLHLDLIVGLPQEDYNSFVNSFNSVYSMMPNQLQLGFLKFLKGSRIRKEASLYGYKFKNYPPYELLSNNSISFDEVCDLKGIEEVFERYYNSGRFINTLKYLGYGFFDTPFEIYHDLYRYFKKHGHFNKPLPSRSLYTILYDFMSEMLSNEEMTVFRNILKLDYLSSDNSNNLPNALNRELNPRFKEICFQFLQNKDNIDEFLPKYVNSSPKQVFKNVHFEIFDFDMIGNYENRSWHQEKNVILFDYSERNKVSGLYCYQKIPIEL